MKKASIPAKENKRHLAAFNYWCVLTSAHEKRVNQLVARRIRVSVQTICTWKRRFRWSNRFKDWNKQVLKHLDGGDEKVFDHMEQEAIRVAVNSKMDYRIQIEQYQRVLQGMILEVLDPITKKLKLKRDPKTNKMVPCLFIKNTTDLGHVVSAFEKLSKLDLLIMGENVDGQNVNINITVDDGDDVESEY